MSQGSLISICDLGSSGCLEVCASLKQQMQTSVLLGSSCLPVVVSIVNTRLHRFVFDAVPPSCTPRASHFTYDSTTQREMSHVIVELHTSFTTDAGPTSPA